MPHDPVAHRLAVASLAAGLAATLAAACADPVTAHRPASGRPLEVPDAPSRYVAGSTKPWEILVLGSLGGPTITVHGINDENVVVGRGVTGGGNTVAWRWRRGTLAELHLPFQYTKAAAHAVNASGQIVGWAKLENGWDQAFVYADATGAVGIQPWIQPDIFGTVPYAINAGGTIVGTMRTFWDAIEWTPAGGDWTWAALPSLGGAVDEAAAVNDGGVIVGTSLVPQGVGEAMIGWVKHPGSPIFVFPSFGEITKVGDINAGNVIVGATGDPPGLGTHFRRSATGVMTDLHLPTDSIHDTSAHVAVEISDRGRIVGTDGALRRAFTLLRDTLTYLPLPAGATRSRAGDVSTCGAIAGTVSFPGKNEPEVAVLWRRVSGTPARPRCDAP